MNKNFRIRSTRQVGHEYVKVHYDKISVVAWVIPEIATRFSKDQAMYFIQINPGLGLVLEEIK